jgi:acyl-CoA synthetase (AMP-forming)/AMP-acid ligase II
MEKMSILQRKKFGKIDSCSFTPPFVNRTKDGFGRTGDLGYYRDDGILCFSGRLKDLIKYQGNHLYPKELEMIIQKHPGVVEVVVFGLPDPDVQVNVSPNFIEQVSNIN